MRKYASVNNKKLPRRLERATIIKRMKEKYPQKWRARDQLRYAVKMGRIIKLACYCGNPKSEAHHFKGYNGDNWKEVQWLCQPHHMERHRKYV